MWTKHYPFGADVRNPPFVILAFRHFVARSERTGWLSIILEAGRFLASNEKAGASPASHSMSPSDGSFMHP
jgi:hypothetical protein